MKYADAGVSIPLAEQAKQRIRRLAARTFTRGVRGGIGAFKILIQPGSAIEPEGKLIEP